MAKRHTHQKGDVTTVVERLQELVMANSGEDTFDEIFKMQRRGSPIKDSLSFLQNLKYYYLYNRPSPKKSCLAFQRNFKVQPTGDVRICTEKYPFLGNILQEPPEEIWNSKKAMRIRNEMKKCRTNCTFSSCYYPVAIGENIRQFFKYLSFH